MKILIAVLGGIGLMAIAVPQKFATASSSATDISDTLLVAVSRDPSQLKGGIGPGSRTNSGTVAVEPFARVTLAGRFHALPCESEYTQHCKQFERQYLSKGHDYTVVSSIGYGARVHADPAMLDECFDFAGKGSYSGASIERSAVAAAATDPFAAAPPLTPLSAPDTATVDKLLKRAMPGRLDSTKFLRAWSSSLDNHEIVIIQRAYSDIVDPDTARVSLVFAIVEMEGKNLHVLSWKRNTQDENEQVLGTIKLRSGQDFLISVVSHPEGHFYRIYGYQQNQLRLIFQGGGSSC